MMEGVWNAYFLPARPACRACCVTLWVGSRGVCARSPEMSPAPSLPFPCGWTQSQEMEGRPAGQSRALECRLGTGTERLWMWMKKRTLTT